MIMNYSDLLIIMPFFCMLQKYISLWYTHKPFTFIEWINDPVKVAYNTNGELDCVCPKLSNFSFCVSQKK